MRDSRSPFPAVLVLVAIGAASSLACRKETIDKPDAPAMADVIAAFAAPTGTFDTAAAARVRGGLDDAANGLLGAGVPDRILEGIEAAIADAEKNDTDKNETKSLKVQPNALEPRAFVGEGFGRVTRICDGWGAEPVPDAANGRLALTFTFAETGLDPIVWGDVRTCLFLVGSKRLRLDRGGAESDLRLFVGENRKVADLKTMPVILALDVAAAIEDKPISGKIAVRFVYKSKTVELLLPVPDGQVVVTFDGIAPSRVRAKNGTFQCDPARRCRGDAGGEVIL